MRKEKAILIGDKEIVARELTVAQVDGLLTGSEEERQLSAVELLINSTIPLECVILSTGLSSEYLNTELTPTEAHTIWQAVEEVNSFLSELVSRLARITTEIEKAGKNCDEPSAG